MISYIRQIQQIKRTNQRSKFDISHDYMRIREHSTVRERTRYEAILITRLQVIWDCFLIYFYVFQIFSNKHILI